MTRGALAALVVLASAALMAVLQSCEMERCSETYVHPLPAQTSIPAAWSSYSGADEGDVVDPEITFEDDLVYIDYTDRSGRRIRATYRITGGPEG